LILIGRHFANSHVDVGPTYFFGASILAKAKDEPFKLPFQSELRRFSIAVWLHRPEKLQPSDA
jgi:hypothetical protein